MKKYPKIANWDQLKEQFGLTDKPGYKNAKDISRDLTFIANNYDFDTAPDGDHKSIKSGLSVHKSGNAHEMSIACIDYQLNNPDSGICIFEYKGVIDGLVTFEFLSTAK
jgi:hypothetical protein